MQKFVLAIMFIYVIVNCYSQTFDLIVTTTGDSIACQIDSVSDMNIYFEIKIKGNWVHTNIERSEITEFQYKTIDKKLVVFKPGSSYIESLVDTTITEKTMFDIQRNSVYYELAGNGFFSGSVNYDRLFPISNKAGFILRGGIAYYEGILLIGEVNLLAGSRKHYFELGFGTTFHIDRAFPILRTGYRYMGKKGLLIRVAPLFILAGEDYPQFWFGVTVGYSF